MAVLVVLVMSEGDARGLVFTSSKLMTEECSLFFIRSHSYVRKRYKYGGSQPFSKRYIVRVWYVYDRFLLYCSNSSTRLGSSAPSPILASVLIMDDPSARIPLSAPYPCASTPPRESYSSRSRLELRRLPLPPLSLSHSLSLSYSLAGDLLLSRSLSRSLLRLLPLSSAVSMSFFFSRSSTSNSTSISSSNISIASSIRSSIFSTSTNGSTGGSIVGSIGA
mmetsp:Transcript_48063/g.124857  ORF Transcript_48063/g.124857 Transcript_48063/m.124857 type:complete len:221 (+) Transcript_48063:674-1336(+)